MDKFTTHSGVTVPLRRSNVDTDQIIPAVYLKRVTRSGFEDGLFKSWRDDPDFVLNQDAYKNGTVLVWALQNYGFKAVIGSRFGDIFRGNAGKAGLLLATVPPEVVEELWTYAEDNPGARVTVDLEARRLTAGDKSYPFDVDDYTRHRLLEGLDDISLTLRHEDDIKAYEDKRPSFKPVTTEVA